jgi:hypothetical protein
MVRKEKLVIALAWLLVMASMIVSAQVMQGARLHAFEHMVHPQGKLLILFPHDFQSVLTTFTTALVIFEGCRCCWFIWKPLIRCGKTCCEDGCCT